MLCPQSKPPMVSGILTAASSVPSLGHWGETGTVHCGECRSSPEEEWKSSTVHNIIKRFRETGEISVHKGQGRRPLLDARGLRTLRRHCLTYWHDSVIDITKWAQEYFRKPLSVNTIHRAICRCQLKLYHAKRKPYVNMVQKRHSVLWAKAHLKWTVSKWKSVLWSDESKFGILVGNHGRRVLRLKRRETFQHVISVQFKSQHLWWYGGA